MKKKIQYYSDEQNDDFSGIHRSKILIDRSYKYKHGFLWRGVGFVLYRFIMFPVAFLYMKIKFHYKIINKKKIKQHKRRGFYLYANHTHIPADGFLPSLICFPKGVKVLVCSENVSLFGTKNFMAMIGATPIPNRFSGNKNFKEYLQEALKKGYAIMIYPEAHVWPYYTKIRDFPNTSFTYPVVEGCPVYCFTTTYHKKFMGAKIIVYVDGPFYPDKTLSVKDASEKLKNEIFMTMKKRSTENTYEKIIYKKREKD